MATYEFKLPDLGEGVVEGEIVKWMVKEGDQVQPDQVLLEVMTDKATVTVPSPLAGRVVKTIGQEGDMAKVHHLLVIFEVEGAGAAASTPAHGASAPAATPATAAAASPAKPAGESKVLATPVTRRMAREHGIDLAEIAGSGAQGRVTKADLVALVGNGAVATGTQSAAPEVAISAKAPAGPSRPLSTGAEDQRIPLRGLRKKIAEKMVRSKYTAPHYTFVEEVDFTELSALRQRLNTQLAATKEAKLSFLPFICKAVLAAMRKYPLLNANFDDATQELIVRGQFNFGIAAATEDGLTVPVVHGVDRLSLKGLSAEIGRLAEAARSKKLKMEELSGGTFTISSLGITGGLMATPIINYPEVAILGVHRMKKRPVVKDDQIVIRDMLNLSLSFDHRVIDGALGAEFAYAVIRYLENPDLLMMEMT